MTCDTPRTGTDPSTPPPPVLPPAPRSWPHIATRDRSAGPRCDHRTRPRPTWPEKTGEHPPRQRRGTNQGRGTRQCPVARHRPEAAGARAASPSTAGTGSAGTGPATEDRATGRHRAARAATPVEPAAHPGPEAASGDPGPSDIRRRARRYDRRMTHRAAASRGGIHTGPVASDHDAARWTQRPGPARVTRFPTVRPGSTPLPGTEPARHAPERPLRRSPARNPIRRPHLDEHRRCDHARAYRLRPGRRQAPVAHRRLEMLIGTALTTVFIAFPLGPGTTAAAYTGEPTVITGVGRAAGHDAPGDPIHARPRAGAEPVSTGPSAIAVDIALQTARATGNNSAQRPAGAAPSGSRTPAPSARSALRASRSGRSETTAGRHARAVSRGPITLDSPATDSSTAVAERPPAGSSRARGCGAGSNSGSTGSATACGLIPLVRDLVRELIRLAPRPVPPCGCPGRAS